MPTQREDIHPVGRGDHVVEPGDSMSSIAERHGFFWETLWNLGANAELRAERRDPEVLLPGDRVTIRPLRRREETCATGARHVFRRRGVPVKIAFAVRDGDGKPFAGKKFALQVGARSYEGQTDAGGVVTAWVEPLATAGRLRVWLDTPGFPEAASFTLQIGQLRPLEAMQGVQARLDNLGYPCEGGEATKRAIEAFQRDHGLEPTGELDDATRERIGQVHGV